MEYALTVFILVDGEIKRIGASRFSRIHYEVMPEYARHRIPYSLLVFECEEGKLGDLRYHEGGYLVFNEEGKLDETMELIHLRLVQAGENDPRSFGARRAEQVEREKKWYPSGEQLNRMIAMAKRNK